MKRYFTTTCFTLLAFLAWAQSTLTVSGTVYNAAGTPVPHWQIYALAGDSSQWSPVTPGPTTAVTDLDGHYTLTLDLPAGTGTATVLTDDGCTPVSGMVAQIVTAVNGAATADFFICAELPAGPDCSAYAWYEPTPDSLTVVLHPDFWAVDNAPAASYLWDFGDGATSTESNPTHAYAAGGEYIVTLTVTSATGCTAVTETYVWVGNQPPFPDCWAWVQVEPTGDSLTFSFQAQAFAGLFGDPVGGTTYEWNFGDGSTSTEVSPTHTYAEQGIYDVSVIVTTETGCLAFGSFPLWTDLPPVPDCRAYIVQNQIDTVSFAFSAAAWTIDGSDIDIVTYEWDFGDGATSTEAEPAHVYAEPGLYTVSLHGWTSDSCEIYACDVVMACNCPIDTFWYGCQAMFAAGFGGFDPNGNPVGDGLTVTFWDMSLGAVQSWAWDFGDGATSTEQNPVHTYAAEGIYTVTLSITTLDDCESTVSFEVYAGDDFPWLPEPDCQALFIPMPDSLGSTGIQFIDYSFSPLPITSWAWDFGDGSTSTEQNPYHVYAEPGEYVVTLSITGDSCNSAISFPVDTDSPWQFANQGGVQLGLSGGALSAPEPAAFSKLRVVPNPVNDAAMLTFTATAQRDLELRITDLAGRTVATAAHSAPAGSNALPLPVNGLTPGVYLVQLVSGNGVETVKVVKH